MIGAFWRRDGYKAELDRIYKQHANSPLSLMLALKELGPYRGRDYKKQGKYKPRSRIPPGDIARASRGKYSPKAEDMKHAANS